MITGSVPPRTGLVPGCLCSEAGMSHFVMCFIAHTTRTCASPEMLQDCDATLHSADICQALHYQMKMPGMLPRQNVAHKIMGCQFAAAMLHPKPHRQAFKHNSPCPANSFKDLRKSLWGIFQGAHLETSFRWSSKSCRRRWWWLVASCS